jgi:beta-phosphoglucomutase-like phosphatase (HAD superfamily)
VAVEDSVNGVRAAKAAGMGAVAVPSSLTAGMDFSAADAVVASCTELSPWVLGRVGARRIGS